MKVRIKNIFSGKYILLLFSALLFILAFIYGNIYFNSSSVSKEVRQLEKNLHQHQKEFSQFLGDTSLINKIIQKNESLNEFNGLVAKDFGIYLFSSDVFGTAILKFWNQQLIMPPPEIQGFADGEYYLSLSNGKYLAIKKTMAAGNGQNNIVACALILIQSKFFIETAYLPEQFSYSPTAGNRILISDEATSFPVKSITGKTICFLDKKGSLAIPYNNWIANFFKFTGIFLFLIFLLLYTNSRAQRTGIWNGITWLILNLILLRLVIYFFPALLNLRQFELFDPSIYGSSPVNRSLGDLLINSIYFSD